MAVEKTEETQTTSESNPSESECADRVPAYTSPGPTKALLEPAVFSTIVLIDYDDCWLTPCGFWKGPTNTTKKFEDLKLSFLGKAPSKDFLSQDFSTIIQNSKSLMDETSINEAKKSGFLVTTKKGENAIRLRHVVFEVFSYF